MEPFNHHERLILTNKSNMKKVQKLESILKSIEKVDLDINTKLKMHMDYIISLKISYRESLMAFQSIRQNFVG
ncbi:MAG: hypothetical protein Harvfovirus47_7 [Harvfovirus sp.]|uniref:Uncharacterized protein n=1 Tax=Harvfovirus sp. TaxID=2487768 RepID=A0A3G5A328_9VIRU|nr:MAG: hypothetical protein Harvfovirus47_7 [Harvfovirus sp.]